ncbi:MAG: hypothetical protein J0I26_01970 [Alphaproteobacteria bacterium]|jgi:hypothetical protein|nr:hypothetical protein [Alphaproteobacteria bacterium]MBN9556278.1 hypothetical protein [Alphaproteobacteria bacterium]MBN9568549.1 hypothetical protein [Alphaproteobacteria bacterium]MBN9571935.1 hypothetical protein [Alphaproteobacteria bacterium]MBN9577654.1 hypothetical protein [Alphaproteobacteria bacterium]
MGKLVADHSVPRIQSQLNQRFSPGDELTLMVALHKEFQIFNDGKALRHTAALLNILPADQKDRKGWFAYLENLKKVPSDAKGQNGHDRVIGALQQNLSSKAPLPVYFTWHLRADNPGVSVSRGTPLSFSHETYLVISVPTIPARPVIKSGIAPRRRPTR